MEETKTITEEQVNQVANVLSEERKNNPDVVKLDEVLQAKDPTKIEEEPWVQSLAEEAIPKPTPEDLKELLKLNNRVSKGEKFPVFNSLPAYFKTLFKMEAAKAGIDVSNKQAMNAYARMFISSFVSEAKLDEAYGKFEDEMKEILQGKDLFESLLDEDLNRNTNKLEELAKKLEEDGKADKAERVRKYSTIYQKAIDYKILPQVVKDGKYENKLKNGGKFIKRDDRFFTEYEYKLTLNGYSLSESMKQSMLRFAGAFRLSYDQASRFFVALCIRISKVQDEKDQLIMRYHALDTIKKVSRTNLSQAESEFVKRLVNEINETVKELDELCNQDLYV